MPRGRTRTIYLCGAALLASAVTLAAIAALENSGISGALGLFSAAVALFGAGLAIDVRDG